MKLTFILSVLVMSVACSKDSSQGQSQPPAAKIGCQLPPVQSGEAVATESHQSAQAKLVSGDDYTCGKLKGAEDTPELILVYGNQAGLGQLKDRLDWIAQYWVNAAAASHRNSCVFILSRKNLERIAARKNVERIVLIGHGVSGDLVDNNTGKQITPESLPRFESTKISKVTFFSCQAGQKIERWREVFGNSSGVEVDSSKDNILVLNALDDLKSMADSIAQCEQ